MQTPYSKSGAHTVQTKLNGDIFDKVFSNGPWSFGWFFSMGTHLATSIFQDLKKAGRASSRDQPRLRGVSLGDSNWSFSRKTTPSAKFRCFLPEGGK